jgi:hypothetical protein
LRRRAPGRRARGDVRARGEEGADPEAGQEAGREGIGREGARQEGRHEGAGHEGAARKAPAVKAAARTAAKAPAGPATSAAPAATSTAGRTTSSEPAAATAAPPPSSQARSRRPADEGLRTARAGSPSRSPSPAGTPTRRTPVRRAPVRRPAAEREDGPTRGRVAPRPEPRRPSPADELPSSPPAEPRQPPADPPAAETSWASRPVSPPDAPAPEEERRLFRRRPGRERGWRSQVRPRLTRRVLIWCGCARRPARGLHHDRPGGRRVRVATSAGPPQRGLLSTLRDHRGTARDKPRARVPPDPLTRPHDTRVIQPVSFPLCRRRPPALRRDTAHGAAVLPCPTGASCEETR